MDNHYFTNNENLKSEIKELNLNIPPYNFKFISDEGVFSKRRIDYGSYLLITEYLKENKEKLDILDLGCGYGVIGITISKITGCFLTSIDINKRCVHLTKRNLKLNEVDGECFYSDGFENVNKTFDLIITNPPIRVGKEKLLDLLTSSKEYLKESGELWYVIRKDQGALSINKELSKYYNINIVKKSKGYQIIKAKKQLTA